MKVAKFQSLVVTIILTSLFFFGATSFGEWIEAEKMTLGDVNMTSKYLIEIPNSDYVLWGGSNVFNVFQLGPKIVIFDINSGKIRGTYNTEVTFYDPIIIPVADSGWNIYVYISSDETTKKFGKLHITKDGLFDELSYLNITSSMKPLSIGVPSRGVAWYAGDKIYRLKAENDELTTFDYPEGWDSNFKNNYIFLTKANRDLFIIAKANTVGNYQGLVINLESGLISSRFILDGGDFDRIYDIDKWKSHDNKYLIVCRSAIWIFDAVSGTSELNMNGFNIELQNIIQTEDGKYLYLFEYYVGHPKSIYEMSLEEKSVNTHPLPLEKGCYLRLYSTIPYFDEENNRIVALSIDLHMVFKPVYIDLSDFSLNYIPKVEFSQLDGFIYNHEKESIVAYSKRNAEIIVADINQGEQKRSINLGFSAKSWSIMHESEAPSLIGNSAGNGFVRLIYPFRRESIKTGSKVLNLCLYKDGTRAFISEEAGYKEYLLDDGTSQDIQLSYGVDNLYPDPSKNMILGIGSNAIQFIEPQNQVNLWKPADENLQLKTHNYDTDNELVWMGYQNSSTNEWSFYEVSSRTFQEINSFTLSSDSFTEIVTFVLDPTQQYLYFIDRNTEAKTRELVIVNIDAKQVAKRITIQENVEDTKTYCRTIPGIIPIPSKERLFLWDHYDAWIINTQNLEVLYGSVKNPSSATSTPKDTEISIYGKFNENDGSVLIVDLSYFSMDTSDHPSVIKYDLNTESITQRIDLTDDWENCKVFFSKENDKIFLLDSSEAELYTLHLNPAWDTPATISPSTNYVQLGSGDNAKFTVNIKNPYDFEQRATAYIWLYAPDGTMLFFGPMGLTLNIAGIPLTLPANTDVTGDILSFTMPAGVPEGFYNFNAVFINEKGDRGPIGTWNFYVKD